MYEFSLRISFLLSNSFLGQKGSLIPTLVLSSNKWTGMIVSFVSLLSNSLIVSCIKRNLLIFLITFTGELWIPYTMLLLQGWISQQFMPFFGPIVYVRLSFATLANQPARGTLARAIFLAVCRLEKSNEGLIPLTAAHSKNYQQELSVYGRHVSGDHTTSFKKTRSTLTRQSLLCNTHSKRNSERATEERLEEVIPTGSTNKEHDLE